MTQRVTEARHDVARMGRVRMKRVCVNAPFRRLVRADARSDTSPTHRADADLHE